MKVKYKFRVVKCPGTALNISNFYNFSNMRNNQGDIDDKR